VSSFLRRTVSRAPLRLRGRRELERQLGRQLGTVPRIGFEVSALPTGPDVLASEDCRSIYPVVAGVPALLAPERLVPGGRGDPVDLRDPRYHEAYEEMGHYNEKARALPLDEDILRELMGAPICGAFSQGGFPLRLVDWIDARHDSLAQLDAYTYLSPLQAKIFLQLGGCGSHAVKALLAGCREALLVTPMLGEAEFALELAGHFSVADRLSCVLGVGEELPLGDACIDAVYSGGCIHHMRTDRTLAELERVLAPGGRFAASEPWKTPFYAIGTRVFGKREASVFCRPIDEARLEPLRKLFPSSRIERHGPLIRYPMIVLEKFGLRLAPATMLRLARLDDRLGRWLPSQWRGSLFLGGEKPEPRGSAA
jgi:SAM-dependent methyltransferase/uncharacterized protein YbaR (Trm112 family)